ncbi:MAG: SH3 domain-containing protein [Cutibacterium avidum]|uniref:C40 family peptidase n=1 Tax=Cutibacterium avidum TaxID=33010 RepID=UPI0022DEF639|nr:SH3 domain-containing protein [Cutibacterium avidum]MDU3748125.1 SH3 domain-containing protein [Cutibacterium avidum]MDU4207029.1 SH3 domain-containing protein [Cutibacterium avidum]MDU4636077.1 SH3 domain-containing protein [Cutibacterium avidum]MDU4676716.1 SH3 domain-containing protein [Cutibacterium avidum]MDU5299524.1 SH3 domain-containing protein [Cutibacterium avidum]
MGVVRPLRAGVATLATAGLAISGSQFFVPQAQASKTAVLARVSARTAVNIRSQAGVHGKILGVLERGQQLNQTGTPVNGWVPVAYRGHTAYVDHHYLSSVAWRPSTSNPSASSSPVGFAQATTYVNVRAGHSMQTTKVGMLSPGEKVGLTGRTSQGFSEVVYNGVHRWVASRYLSTTTVKPTPKPTPKPAHTTTVYTTANLNLRNGASMSASVATTVSRGTALTTTGRTTGIWTQVNYHGHNLWASSTYLTTTNPAPKPTPTPRPSVSPSSARAAIVNYAKAQVGKAYIWGGEGPNGFDCSGLVLKAYQQAGIYLPHYSGSQIARGHRISLDEIQPGDLLAKPGGGHIAIYVGNGQIVEAANPRAGVRLTSIYSSLYPLRIDSDILD